MNVLDDEAELETVLAQVDPFNNKKMTYSEVVSVFSKYKVPRAPDQGNNISIMAKFNEIADTLDIDQSVSLRVAPRADDLKEEELASSEFNYN